MKVRFHNWAHTRRWVMSAMGVTTLGTTAALAAAANPKTRRVSILDFGAVADDRTVNTPAIQQAIDQLAGTGGGTVVVPAGVFVTGAIFLKPQVHLHLDKGAVLRASTDVAVHFPARRTRIEGHFEDKFTPALINAARCDGLKITGEGTLDGAGRVIWDQFWKLRNAAPVPNEFPNIGLPRARLALIENSKNVLIEGVTFKDSQFWNLHIYRCRGVTVRRASFQVPDDYKQAPSTDGIDLDSCQDVIIEGCHFSVTDDCIAAKGTKGPHALSDKDSPPVERIRVRDCVFKRGHNMFTCGSEATIVRDVIVENCTVTGGMSVLMLKLRADTPQHYENILYRNLTLDAAGGNIVRIQPWSQYINLKGEAPPQSVVRNVRMIGLRGRFGGFGNIRPNPGQTTISDIRLEDFDVQLTQAKLAVEGVKGLKTRNVRVNGQPVNLV
ncbi:glycosyl hydrolase family 28 protein [Asticcacaulis sp. BYS171W]|uniref:Glycosyl hydrolase family 28 protein n=1 Tax=Asticcacaulis aquaticus TaxID=2984212 RepID=A0ABT5HXR2_9CAUL|nr:glycosyl hydrolase family 28 protein [Asticcacaulis aquaticus]MDC7684829.1 glycosyl hydrolase family 28 protein [Asticcacaulis aquaticus]